MCLLVLAWRAHPRYRLILAGNRDEFHNRPTEPARWWAEYPDLCAGRDLQGGGTWLGVTRSGRFGVVTNFREPNPAPPAAPSRGGLVVDYLNAGSGPREYTQQALGSTNPYAGFNLLVGDFDGLHYVTNRAAPSGPVSAGLHGLSNHLLDTPWPKVRRSLHRLDRLLQAEAVSPDALFGLLADTTTAGDAELPHTGLDPALEQRLSAPFVIGPIFGTRCSSVLLIDEDHGIRFIERGFDADGQRLWQHEFRS